MASAPPPANRWSETEPRGGRAVAGAALIDKAFQLLEAIGRAPGLVTPTQLVRSTGWSRPTVYRILQSITAHGFVRFDPIARGYTLGYRFLELAQNVWVAPDLAAASSIELQRLRDMTGETAYLAAPDEGSVVALGKFESAHDHRSSAGLGVRKPMHCTSQGKAILAFMPGADAERILQEPLERLTPRTIVDRAALIAQFSVIRARGYAIDDEEIVLGTRCVGAPILDSSGKPVAAISVAGPAYRLTMERVEQLGPEIVSVAQNIGLRLRGASRQPVADAANPHVHPGENNVGFYGANPIWDGVRSALIWCDRLGPSIYGATAGGSDYRPDLAAPVDALLLDRKGVIAFLAGHPLRIGKGERTIVGDAPDLAGLSAVEVDDTGTAWGAITSEAGTIIGRLTRNGVAQTWRIAAQISALAWDPLSQTLYAADGKRGTIYAASRKGAAPRVFTRIPRVSGEPRALAVDGEGRLWIALYDGWSVARMTADGEFDRTIALPAPRPTGLCFGGDDLQTLFITTARIGLARDVLENAPLSGRLLVAHPGSRGWRKARMAADF